MKIWIVELWDNGKWYSTSICGLTRKDGRERLREHRKDWPNDEKYRLRKYVREED